MSRRACLVASLVGLRGRAVRAGETTLPGEAVEFVTESLRGQVVWLAEALRRKYGIITDVDAAEANVALETLDGHLWPIVKDARGRGFHLDERLRQVELEVLARRFDGSPVIQLIQVYRLRGASKYELDYWCDICSIPMYELKPCECCQGPTRLRERLADTTPESGR